MRMIFSCLLLFLISGCFCQTPECPKEVPREVESPDLLKIFRSEGYVITARVKFRDGKTEPEGQGSSSNDNKDPSKKDYFSQVIDVYDFASGEGYITVKPDGTKNIGDKIYYNSKSMIIQSNECKEEKLDREKIHQIIFKDRLKKIPITSLFESLSGPIGILKSINNKIFPAEVLDDKNEPKRKWAFCDEKKEEFKITFNPEDLDKFIKEKSEDKAESPEKSTQNVEEGAGEKSQSKSGNKFNLKIAGLKTGAEMYLHFYKHKPTAQERSKPDCKANSNTEPKKPGAETEGEDKKPGTSDQSGSSAGESKDPNGDGNDSKNPKEPDASEPKDKAPKSDQSEKINPPHSSDGSKKDENKTPKSEPSTKPSSPDSSDGSKKNEESSKGENDKKDESKKEPESDKKSGGKDFPKFGQFSSKKTGPIKLTNFRFKIQMRAQYFKPTQSGKKQINSDASISYADDVFILETRSNHQSDANRLIYDKNFNLLYSVNQKSRECSIDYVPLVPLLTFYNPNVPGYRWPQLEDLFNLLNLDIWTPEYKTTKYIENEEVDSKKFDVFERVINNFYVGPKNIEAKVTYHFTADDATKPPNKILIQPVDSDLSFYAPEIHLEILDYTEEPEDDYDHFDISACYQNPGLYRWVQFTVDNIPKEIALDGKKDGINLSGCTS